MSETAIELVCPICEETNEFGRTIECEGCKRWFHFDCVGVCDTDPVVSNEDLPFFCNPTCANNSSNAIIRDKKIAQEERLELTEKAKLNTFESHAKRKLTTDSSTFESAKASNGRESDKEQRKESSKQKNISIESKSVVNSSHQENWRLVAPNGNSINIREDMAIPKNYDNEAEIVEKVLYCSMSDCTNYKRYNCSKTGRPLCSLNCYKKSMSELFFHQEETLSFEE